MGHETSEHYLLFIPLWKIGFKFLPSGGKKTKQVDLAGGVGCVESAVMEKKISSCRGSVGRERELGTAMLSAAAGKVSPRDGNRQTPRWEPRR